MVTAGLVDAGNAPRHTVSFAGVRDRTPSGEDRHQSAEFVGLPFGHCFGPTTEAGRPDGRGRDAHTPQCVARSAVVSTAGTQASSPECCRAAAEIRRPFSVANKTVADFLTRSGDQAANEQRPWPLLNWPLSRSTTTVPMYVQCWHLVRKWHGARGYPTPATLVSTGGLIVSIGAGTGFGSGFFLSIGEQVGSCRRG